MTESLMCSLICFLIFALANFKGRLKEYFFAIGILILISFTRPTAVIIIFASLVFLFTYHRKIINTRPILKFTILAGLLVAGYFVANLLFGYWDFTDQYEKGNIVTYMDTIEGELLYRKNLRIETSDVKLPSEFHSSVEKLIYFVVKNPMYFLKSSCLKVAYLISGVRPYYSLVHNIYSIVWLSLNYLLFYFGYINATNQAIKNFTLSVVIANCALIAISTVDWDNRFYVPMQPGIVLMAGGGASYLFAIYKTKIATLFRKYIMY
jgi:hypothetical protein